jgi:hypothetical protein
VQEKQEKQEKTVCMQNHCFFVANGINRPAQPFFERENPRRAGKERIFFLSFSFSLPCQKQNQMSSSNLRFPLPPPGQRHRQRRGVTGLCAALGECMPPGTGEFVRASVMLVAAMYLAMVVSGVKMYWFYYHAAHLRPVPDLVLDNIPYIGRAAWIDHMLTAFIICIVLLFLARAPGRIHRIGRTLAWVHVLRAVSVSVTHVPDANWAPPGDISVAGIFNPFGIDQVHRYGDMMFSGHTATIVVLFLAYWTFARRRRAAEDSKWIHGLAWAESCTMAVWMAVNIALVLVCRYHYTNDVVIGVYMGVFLWNWHGKDRGPGGWNGNGGPGDGTGDRGDGLGVYNLLAQGDRSVFNGWTLEDLARVNNFVRAGMPE